jgi:hypothetical protein
MPYTTPPPTPHQLCVHLHSGSTGHGAPAAPISVRWRHRRGGTTCVMAPGLPSWQPLPRALVPLIPAPAHPHLTPSAGLDPADDEMMR